MSTTHAQGSATNTHQMSLMLSRSTRASATASVNIVIAFTVLLFLCSGIARAATVTTPSGVVTLVDGWLYSYADGQTNVVQSVTGSVPFVTYTTGSPTSQDSASSDTTATASVSNSNSGYGYSATGTANYGTSGAIASTGPSGTGIYPIRNSAFELQPGDVVASADAGSSWGDGFVITGGSGTATATLNVNVNGTLSAGDIGGAYSAAYQLNYYDDVCSASGDGCPTLVAWDNDPLSSDNVIYIKPPGTTQTVNQGFAPSFDFVYDQPFTLESYLDVASTFGGSADFSHTAGILNFVLPSGATLYSATGTYSTASVVPLPAAFPLLMSGLTLLGFTAQRRHRVREIA